MYGCSCVVWAAQVFTLSVSDDMHRPCWALIYVYTVCIFKDCTRVTRTAIVAYVMNIIIIIVYQLSIIIRTYVGAKWSYCVAQSPF